LPHLHIHQPIQQFIACAMTSAVNAVGDLTPMVMLPTLVVGNDLLIINSVAVGGYIIAYRHRRLLGFVDANQNGRVIG
jgi:hypothetical protein